MFRQLLLSIILVTMKIDIYSLLPDNVKDFIADEISEALAKNGHDNSIVLWDISCELPEEV